MDPLSIGNESPAARQSILGSFLRTRPRGTSQSHPSPPHESTATRDSPPPLPSADTPGHRRRPAAAAPLQPVPHSQSAPGFSQMLRRRRSAGTLANTATSQHPAIAVARTAGPPSATPAPAASPSGPSHRIRLVPHLDSRRSLRFDPICRDVKEGDTPLRIGRFTDRSGLGLAAANALGSNKLAFKSKVVSRAHAEIWVEAGGHFFIKDTKSSSGTFLNHVRLSAANTESRPSELKDGDLLQLGVDYQGGTEDIYKCVKIKIEMGREWQAQSNPFNANALKQLKAIAIPSMPGTVTKRPTVASKSALPDCCICLFPVSIHQALFIAPCSHAYHYKCIRPLLETHHPAFSCPICRTFADLEEDVEVELEVEPSADDDAAEVSAALASVVSVVPQERPDTGDSSRERNRERDRERDAGAETEVEAEMLPMRISRRARRASLPLTAFSHDGEDFDEEMEDAALPLLMEGTPMDGDVDGMFIHDGRDSSISPDPVPVPGPAHLGRRSADTSEGEGEGEVNGDVDVASDGSGSGSGSRNGRTTPHHPKRKR